MNHVFSRTVYNPENLESIVEEFRAMENASEALFTELGDMILE